MLLRYLIVFSLVLMVGCQRKPTSAVKKSPLTRAISLLSRKQPDAALKECDSFLLTEPNNFHGHMLRGEILEALAKNEAALAAYRAAFQLRPLDLEVRTRMLNLDADRPKPMDDRVVASLALQEENSPSDVADHGDEKAYRYVEPSTVPERTTPTPRPTNNSIARLSQAIIAGQAKDLAAKERLSKPQPRSFYVAAPMDPPPPRTVTRFDMGLGAPVLPEVEEPEIEPTRRRGSSYHGEPLALNPRRAIVGQIIPDLGGRRCRPGYFDFPVDYQGDDRGPQQYQLNPLCADGLDNNGNGLSDQNDPMCWADGVNPGSYSRWLDEGSGFLPPEFLPPPIETPLTAPASPVAPPPVATPPVVPTTSAIPTPAAPPTPVSSP